MCMHAIGIYRTMICIHIYVNLYMYTHKVLLMMFTTELQLQVLLIVYTDPISQPGEMKYFSKGKI